LRGWQRKREALRQGGGQESFCTSCLMNDSRPKTSHKTDSCEKKDSSHNNTGGGYVSHSSLSLLHETKGRIALQAVKRRARCARSRVKGHLPPKFCDEDGNEMYQRAKKKRHISLLFEGTPLGAWQGRSGHDPIKRREPYRGYKKKNRRREEGGSKLTSPNKTNVEKRRTISSAVSSILSAA